MDDMKKPGESCTHVNQIRLDDGRLACRDCGKTWGIPAPKTYSVGDIVTDPKLAREFAHELAAYTIDTNTDEHLKTLLRVAAEVASYANLFDKDDNE